jgi:hypothetical protein
MAMMISVTQMNDIPVLVGVNGIKMIEASEWTPKPIDPKKGPEVAKDSPPAPVTTQPMSPPTAAADVAPIACSKITFHDDKTLVVKELVLLIHTLSMA